MSIQISLTAPGLQLNANLKDQALAAVIQLIQDHRDDVNPKDANGIKGAPPIKSGPPSDVSNLTGHDNEQPIKAWLQGLGAAELLNRLKWDSYPEKILLLGAWGEAKGGTTPWKSSDMDEIFKQAKEKPPGNFPRDIRTAIKSGLVRAETPRTYAVTRTGWNKIGQAIATLQE
jgi:hypothetical protein